MHLWSVIETNFENSEKEKALEPHGFPMSAYVAGNHFQQKSIWKWNRQSVVPYPIQTFRAYSSLWDPVSGILSVSKHEETAIMKKKKIQTTITIKKSVCTHFNTLPGKASSSLKNLSC